MENSIGTIFSQILEVGFSTIILIIAFHAFLIGWLASYVGETKGIKYGFWFGFLLGELGLLTVGLCSPKNASNGQSKVKKSELEKMELAKEAKVLYEKGYLTEKTYRDIINEK